MANFETQMNSRIIREGKTALAQILDYGIMLDDFRSSEGKGMFQHLLAYYNDASSSGSIPGVNAAQILFPNFELCDDESMGTEKLCEELRRQRNVLEVREIAAKMADDADRDPVKAMADCHQRLQLLMAQGGSKKTDVSFDTAFDDILFEYEQTEAGVNMSKMAWPWPILQEETGGIQKDDYIVFYGRPKSKKSWVLSYLIAQAYNQGKSVLVYTKEMTPHNILKRIAACLAFLPYREFRRGKLSVDERALLFDLRETIQILKQSQNFIVLSGKDVTGGGDTVPWLRSKIEKYKPHVQFVDGLYLMSDSDTGRKNKAAHEKMSSISRAYRQLILDTEIPGVATLQANRKAAGHSNAELDEIAFSDAIGQDATMAARVISEKTSPTIMLKLGGAREFELHGLRIGGVPAVDFTEKGLVTEKDIVKALENDAGDSEPEKKENVNKPRRTPVEAKQNQAKLVDKQMERVG
jgi:hypothetical protein